MMFINVWLWYETLNILTDELEFREGDVEQFREGVVDVLDEAEAVAAEGGLHDVVFVVGGLEGGGGG